MAVAVAGAEAGKQCDKYLNMLISLAMLLSQLQRSRSFSLLGTISSIAGRASRQSNFMCCHLVSTASSSTSYWCRPQSVLHLRTTRLTSCLLPPLPRCPLPWCLVPCCKCNAIHIYEYKLVQYIFMIGMQSAYSCLCLCPCPCPSLCLLLGLYVL